MTERFLLVPAAVLTILSSAGGAAAVPDVAGAASPAALRRKVGAANANDVTSSRTTVRTPSKTKRMRGRRQASVGSIGGTKRRRAISFETTGNATGGVGYMSGLGTLRVQDAFIHSSMRVVPTLRWRDWQVRVVGNLTQRLPLTLSLTESRISGETELRWNPFRGLWLTSATGLSATIRPGWPDPYQPRPDGSLMLSDRYSYTERTVKLRLSAIPFRRHHARIAYEYSISDYDQDPHFDAQLEPIHLIPRDHARHRASATWTVRVGTNVLEAGGRVEHISYFFSFARDRHTGLTHANPGGMPANPLAVFIGLEPSMSWRTRLWSDKVSLSVGYAHEFLRDPFQGYYSYQGPHPTLRVRFAAAGWETKLGLDLRWRSYGTDSYRAGAGHPSLEDGTQLYDRRLSTDSTVNRALGGGVSVYAEESTTIRQSNYPDYVPGVFPASRRYRINWDFWNLNVSGGVKGTF